MATCQEAFPIQEDEHLLVVLRYVERKRVAGAVGAACRAVAMVFAEGLGGRGRRCAVALRPGASGRRLDRLGQPAAKRRGTLGLAQEHRAVYALRRGVVAADHRRPPRAEVQPPRPRQTEVKRMIRYPTIEKQNVPFSFFPFRRCRFDASVDVTEAPWRKVLRCVGGGDRRGQRRRGQGCVDHACRCKLRDCRTPPLLCR